LKEPATEEEARQHKLDLEEFTRKVRKFEEQLDQVVDLTLRYTEQTNRWRNACELRCKPLDGAAEFYRKNFIEPMARQLAPHVLPTYKSGKKKGEYSKKTMALASGAVSFIAGGGYFVHDKDELRKHIEKEGVEKFSAIGAEKKVVWDHDKLIAALKAGVVKDLPGTGYKPTDPFKTVKVTIPKPADKKEEGDDE
jgi:hypothetical protein